MMYGSHGEVNQQVPSEYSWFPLRSCFSCIFQRLLSINRRKLNEYLLTGKLDDWTMFILVQNRTLTQYNSSVNRIKLSNSFSEVEVKVFSRKLKIGPYIKLKLLKSCFQYRNLKTLG